MRRINYAWVILATGFAVLFFSSGSRFAFGLLLKPMSEDLELSRSALSPRGDLLHDSLRRYYALRGQARR